MKGNPKMISTDTHQQFNRALKPAILKQYPAPILNNTTVSQLEAGNFPIEVFPPEVFFKDVEANQNYEVTVTVRNITKNMRRFKFSKPKTSNFRCDFENIGSVAAGLSVKLNVQFEADTEGDYHDFIEIGCEGFNTTYKLQLHAYQPAADIQFEPFVNMKFIPNGETRYQTIDFKNEGKISGFVNLEEETRQKSSLTFDPSSFDIQPNQIVSVTVGLSGQNENLNKKVKVHINGSNKPPKYMEVIATCLDQTLSIVFNEGGGVKSSLNFGTVYMGETREYPAFLINNGPQPAYFKFKFLKGLRNLEEENSSATQDNFISPAEIGKEMTERVLTVFPLSGVVQPYEKVPLEFICRTKKHEHITGFADLSSDAVNKPGTAAVSEQGANRSMGGSSNNVGAAFGSGKTTSNKFAILPEDYASLAVMTFGENGEGVRHQDLRVQMMARAVYPDLKINKQYFNFGEVGQNDRRDMQLSVRNKNKDLPLDFAFTKVAHFRATPGRGKLYPDSEHTINFCFEPKSFGMFKQEIAIEILGGVYRFPIILEGNCRQLGLKTKTVRGPAAKTSDFEPNIILIDDEEAAQTTLKETMNRKVSKDDPALAQLSDADIEAKQAQIQTYLQKKHNRERFNNYVKHERIDRAIDQRVKQKMQETGKKPPQTLEEIEKDLDLGMSYNIKQPRFEPYQAVDPLYVERPIGEYEPTQSYDKLRAKKESQVDRLIKRKFKAEPVTQAELKDCSTELTGQQLQKITVGPSHINFKNVFVKSQATKSFVVTNDLRQHIYVRLMVDAYPELQMSTPLSQVIPPGQEAGFDIIFCSQTVKSFTAPISYYINDRPFNFLVTAQADPVSLELSKKLLKFTFNEDSMEMFATQSLILTNYGNAPARFTWQSPSQVFVPKPLSDEVPAGSSRKVEILFNPNGTKSDEEIIFLKIQDGDPQELKCQGQVAEAKCIFLEKQLDFGNVHVGLQAKDRTFHIKNQLRTPAIFHVSCSDKELSIFPLKGKIQGDTKFAFKVNFFSNQVKQIKTEIVINIRGGKPLRMPVIINSIVPEIFIEEKAIDFGGITFGDQKTLPMTIINESDITAKLILDMRDYPEFDFILPDASPEDDVHSEIMVPIVEQPKYDDIVNMNTDDVDPINEDKEEEEEDEYDEDAKRYVQLSIRPGTKPFVLQLKYTPQGIEDPKNFILPLKLAGYGEIQGLKRRIKAVGIKPRFFVEPTVVNFKTKVIAKGQKPLPFHQDIQIQNPDPSRSVAWRIDRESLEASKVFAMNPMEGVLEPSSQGLVRVTFNPHEPTEYVAKIPLFLDNEKEKPYLVIEYRGEGADAKIYFDRREIILPPVPLNIETKATFQVCHNGYENQQLRCKVANEVGQLPITISFPDGENLGVTKQKVKVEATFMFTSPLSFTTFLDFFDDEGNKFSIPISGTTDNSILTVFSYLQRYFDEIVYRYDKGKPIMLDQSAGSDAGSQKSGFSGGNGGAGGALQRAYSKGGSSIISRTAKSLVGYNPVPSDILERNCEYVCRWFNSSLNSNSMQAFPQDLITQNGTQMYDLITYLSGKRPPGQASSKALAQANQTNAKDMLKVILSQYEELINYLKVNGAHLNTVRPEYLLNTSDYTKFLKLYPKEENMKPKVVERVFPYIAMESWLTVFYQVLRIYYLNRITQKNFKALPGIAPTETVVDASMQKSNIYSVAETILLKWMTYHLGLINPTQGRQLTNFDADLQDSSVFACLIKSHYGETVALKQFRMIATSQEQVMLNAKMILKAVEEIGIQTHIQPNDIAEPSARELMLFCIQLYQSLPHYVPKASIEFPAVLGDLITKNIELSNPSKNPISYWVKLIGSNDFSIEQEQVKIEPGQSVAFPVRFQSRISTQVKGKVIFTNKKEGNIQAAAMVFELVSNVYERNSVEIIQKSTKLYKALQIDLQIENAFPQDVVFNIQIQYEKNQKDAKKKDAKGQASAPAAKGKKDDPKAGAKKEAGVTPEPYFCKLEQIKIRKGAQQTVPILFLPFELGIHKANLIFTDENVGEVQYTIVGKSELPEILDTFTGDCNSEEPFTFKKILNFKNDKLEQARNQITEQSKKVTSKLSQPVDDKLSRKEQPSALTVVPAAPAENPHKLFEIEISNPFFTGPQTMSLADLTAPKNVANKNAPQSQGKDTKSASGQDFNPNQNLLELNCNPTKPASYTCYVILKSLDRTDIRLYEYKLTAIPQKIKAQLEFRVPARGSVVQDIPIVNNSSQEWKVIALLDQSKGGCFSLNQTQKLVKKGITENFSLRFAPTWVCEIGGTLTLKNESTKEEYEYELKGIGEEPLAEDHIVLSCKARETCTHTFEIKNPSDRTVTYDVWTDLQNAVGTKTFTIKPKQSFEYPLKITPLLGGVYTASITFQDNEERFIWWTVEVRTDSPRPEATIDMRANIRKATSAEISLSNPLNEPITFEVFYQGEGLLGDQSFSIEPKSLATYNLIFSPLQAGIVTGNIGFLNEKVGEFWYDLSLTAEENPVQNLELLECELGKAASHSVELENPTAQELFLDFKNTNSTNFEIKPDKVILQPYETLKVSIIYSPTALDVVESGNIIFSHPLIGKWEFNVEGKGLVPTLMEPQPISTAVGNSTSSMLCFKNPFKEPQSVSVHLESTENKIFSLLLKRNKFSMGPLGILQIPYSFSPETMTESKATIVVSMSKTLVWKYPLRGIAESASNTINYHFRTRARQPFEEKIKINLPGFQVVDNDDTFHYELNILNVNHQGLVDRSVFIEQRTNTISHADEPLNFSLRFEPLRPFKTQAEFIIYKSSGGRWKFNAIFEALDPEMDDQILIQSPLHKTSSVSFKLSNHLKSMAEFTAYFTTDSDTEFKVYPKSGLLEPYGKDGTNFIVSFTPTEYGKQKIGKLVIQTDEMQWTYEIRGSHPHYQIPKVQGGRIENKLSKDMQSKLNLAHNQQKNFLAKNLKANQFSKSPQRGSTDRLSGLRRANNNSPTGSKKNQGTVGSISMTRLQRSQEKSYSPPR